MSPVSYSSALNNRGMDYMANGNSQKSASNLFAISTTALSNWEHSYQKQGRVFSLPRAGSKTKVDTKSLQEFVDRQPEYTLKKARRAVWSYCILDRVRHDVSRCKYSHSEMGSRLYPIANQAVQR